MEDAALKPLRMVAMILAGGRVGELSILTLRRPKAALPFAGYYRIIDFPLSNLMHAGIHNVGILSQYRPASLIDHVQVGESWDFVGLKRGAKILPPFRGAEASDWYRGNADAVFQNLNYIRDHAADLVLILSGDHIYKMDYQELIAFHLDRGADMTVAFKRMAPNDRFGYGVLDDDGRLLRYEEKPAAPISDLGSLTIYLANTDALERVLSELRGRELVEFGKHVLPAMMARYRVFGFEFTGHWAYTRTVESYYQAHQDLLSGRIDMDRWGIRSNLQDALIAGVPPLRIGRGAQISNSFISSGCEIEGTVIDSVLSPGCRVDADATVVGSILFHRTQVASGAYLDRVITDKGVAIASGARAGVPEVFPASPPSGPPSMSAGHTEATRPITLLGKECRVGRDAVIAPGAEVQPDDEVPAGARRASHP